MSMNHDEYIDLSVDNIDDTEDIEFDTYNDEIRINPVLKTHLDDGDKLVWYKDPTIIATWHSNGRLDVPCFDATDVTISAVNFRILKGHWRTKDEHGVGTESNHWLYDDKPISEYLDLYPDFWKANEIKAVQPKKERKPRQKKETSDKTVNVILPRQEDIVKEYKYKSEKYLYDSNYSDTYPDKLRKQATPSWVAENMIDLLPDEVWRTNSKFLNIYCKSGIFLEIIIDRLMKKVDYSSIGLTSDREIRQYIIENQVYAICWNKWYLDLSRKAINGKSSMVGNIYCIGPEIENMTEDEAKAVLEDARAQNSIDKAIFGIDIRKEFFNNVKFDIVIGNPPYNNDIYLEFVTRACEWSNKYTCMITPAKWQAKGGKDNEQFRADIVPNMSKIVYYPNPLDVFPNTPMCGDSISYYLIDKTKHDDKYINNELEEHWETRYGLDNTCINIVKKISGKTIVESSDKSITPVKSYFTSRNFGDVSEDIGSRYYMRSSARCIKVPENVFKNTEDMDKYKVYIGHFITNNPVLHLVEPFVADVREDCLLGFGSKEKCESIISYYKCKLIWFLVFMTNCGNAGKEAFVNVPDPGDFDHIFTDEELYKKYNLTDEEINIIESVIKERK